MKSQSVTIGMKATEQYFLVVLFIMLYTEVVLTFESVNEIPKQYVPVVLFIVLYKVVPTFEGLDEIPKCDHSNKSY